MKSLAVCVAILISLPATPQIPPGGTIVVMVYRPDEITMAADSKFSGNLSQIFHTNQSCKISVFGDTMIFSAAHHVVVPAGKEYRWAHQDARDAWSRIMESRSSLERPHRTDSIAALWGAMQVKNWREYFHQNRTAYAPDDTETGRLLIGLFAGIEPSGPRIVQVVITFDQPMYGVDGFVPVVARLTVIEKPPKGSYTLKAIGETQIVQQMKDKEIRASAEANLPQWPIYAAKQLVQDTIDLHPDHDLFSGPVDVLQWSPATGIRWINRKPGCAAH